MKSITCKSLCSLTFGWTLVAMAALSSGQVVSLDSKDTMDDISVSTAEGDFPVTVVRDAYNDRQWYYIPPRPRLVERTTDGETRPVFSMYRYQLPDSAHPGQLIDGGILQFSVTYALKADDIDKVKGIVAQRRGVPASQISLTALRPKSAEVTVYTPGENGTFVTSVNGGGKAPLFATQEMPFTIELNKLGASVYQQIESGQGGVKIGITFKYPGLTPPAGFKVTADYKQLHDYYEHNRTFGLRLLTSAFLVRVMKARASKFDQNWSILAAFISTSPPVRDSH